MLKAKWQDALTWIINASLVKNMRKLKPIHFIVVVLHKLSRGKHKKWMEANLKDT